MKKKKKVPHLLIKDQSVEENTMNKEKPDGDPDLKFLNNNIINKDKKWLLILDYFKKNPEVLLDAIPTPPDGDEYENASDRYDSLLRAIVSDRSRFQE